MKGLMVLKNWLVDGNGCIINVIVLIFTSLFPQTSDSELTNVALGKTGYQSTTNGGHVVERALDGNPDPNLPDNSCSCTNHAAYPWWAVDLGAIYDVREAHITNRAGYQSRLHDFYVGITRVSPAQQAPLVGHFETCAFHAGAVGNSAQIQLSCPPGRYVVIHIDSAVTNEMLTLCEVAIMGEWVGRILDCVNNSELVGHVMKQVAARHVIECATRCSEDPECRSLSYHDGQCGLNSAASVDASELTTTARAKYCTLN